jgi:hypothetical protein
VKKNPLGKLVFQIEISYLSHDELKIVYDYGNIWRMEYSILMWNKQNCVLLTS